MSHAADAALIAEMLDRHAAALELYAAQWTSTAEDCVQEALLQLASLTAKPENPRAWLYRVVRNRALNMARSASRRGAHERSAAAIQARDQARDQESCEAKDLSDAVAALPDELREAIVLRVWGQLTWNEVAAVTGMSSTSMQRRYASGLRMLREIWEIEPCRANSDYRTS